MSRIALLTAFFLIISTAGRAWGAEMVPLAKCAEIRALSREEAARGIPVRLRGVVTFVNSEKSFVIADSTGLWINTVQKLIVVQPGDLLEVAGRTSEGNFAPVVIATGVSRLGSAPLPPPEELTGPALRSGELDGQRAWVRGVVRGRLTPEPGALHSAALILSTMYGQIPIQIYGSDAGIGDWDDAEVEVTGIALAFFNARGQAQGARLAINSVADIRIIQAAPGKPFDAPAIALGEVLRFSPNKRTLHRQQVSGTVTLSQPGKYFFLQDGPHALRIDTRQPGRLQPGDRVEAAGFLDVVDNKPRLVESVFRQAGRLPPPVPVEITVEQALHPNRFPQSGEYPDLDYRLVALHGRLLTFERRDDGGMQLNLVRDGVLIPVEIAGGADSPALRSLAPGSELRVRGICVLTYSESARMLTWPQPVGLRLLARDAADIGVLRRASWWTAERLWNALALTSVVLLSALLWIVLLRRTVARRSRQLAAEMQARHGAAVEFESTLRERTRLAADLHDTLEQSLTGLAMQLEAGEALIDSNLDRSRHHLGLGRQLLSRSREDLRRSIWNLRSIALEEGSLVQALQRVAGHRASGAGVEIAVACEGTPRPVPDLIAGNLLLLAQEAITNTLKHASARGITVTLVFAETTLGLRIQDDGIGFNPQEVAGSSAGHFGLQGMRERIKRLGGKIEITSAPGMGTVIAVVVPG